jgi:hypothetical protein
VVEDVVLADGFRRCRDVVRGGLDRSCFTGSGFLTVSDTRFEEDLCSPPLVGLPKFARGGGWRTKPLPTVLPVELSGLEDIDIGCRVEGLTGSRLGDWPLLSKDFDSPDIL